MPEKSLHFCRRVSSKTKRVEKRGVEGGEGVRGKKKDLGIMRKKRFLESRYGLLVN